MGFLDKVKASVTKEAEAEIKKELPVAEELAKQLAEKEAKNLLK